MNKKLTILSVIGLVALTLVTSSYSNGMSGEIFSGSPGSNGKCTNCHNNITPRGANLIVTVSEKGKITPVTQYSIGKTYTVGISISGGLATARGANSSIVNKSNGQSAGSMANLLGGKIVTKGSLNGFTHNPGTLLGAFAYDWTPSGNIDTVEIYTCAIAGLSDGNSGDQFMENKTTLSKANTGNAKLANKNSSYFYPNPVVNTMYFDKTIESVYIYNVAGKLMGQWNNIQKIDLTAISAGKYFIRYGNANNMNTESLIKM